MMCELHSEAPQTLYILRSQIDLSLGSLRFMKYVVAVVNWFIDQLISGGLTLLSVQLCECYRRAPPKQVSQLIRKQSLGIVADTSTMSRYHIQMMFGWVYEPTYPLVIVNSLLYGRHGHVVVDFYRFLNVDVHKHIT